MNAVNAQDKNKQLHAKDARDDEGRAARQTAKKPYNDSPEKDEHRSIECRRLTNNPAFLTTQGLLQGE